MERLLKEHYPRWDERSDVALCHLSYVLDKVLPRWYVDTMYAIRYRDALKNLTELIVKRISPEDPDSFVFAGSFADGLVIPDSYPKGSDVNLMNDRRLYDLDALYIHEYIVCGYESSRADWIIETNHTRPAYFRLRHRNTNEFVLSDLLIVNEVQKLQQVGLTFTKVGPALNRPSAKLDIDFVCTGCCLSWPREAASWITRYCLSGWPTREMREEMSSQGCHFVAKAHRISEAPELEFRFSLVLAAKKIIEQITAAQRQCYILFKLLIKRCIQDKAFSSYCMKTVFLHALERIPREIWEDEISGLATCLLYLIDELTHGLIEGNIPMYFMPTCNLIDHITTEDLKNNIRQLYCLRKDVLTPVLDYDKTNYIPGLLPEPLPAVLTFVVALAQFRGLPLYESLELQLELDFMYFDACIKSQMLYGALNISSEINKRGLLLKSNRPHIKDALLPRREFMKKLLATGVALGDDRPGDLTGIIATLCSILYMNGSQLRDEYFRRSIEEAFEVALKKSLVQNGTYVYYSYFLMHHGRNDRAISVLHRALLANKGKDMSIGQYFHLMKDHLDEVLLHVLSTCDQVKVPAHILAYHLLIRLYRANGRTEDGKSLLRDFWKDCDYCVFAGIGHLLLAYSCLCLGEYWQAGNAFSRYKTISGRRSEMRLVFPLAKAPEEWLCWAMAVYYAYKQLDNMQR